MKESFYFPHDYNATQDTKMLSLLHECGLEGIGAYWVTIELLHQQPEGRMHISVLENNIRMYFSFPNRGEQHISNICSTMVSTELLQKDGDFIFSNRVLDNKKHREMVSHSRSIAGKASANKRLGTNVQRPIEQNPTKERKGKERKGKEIKNIYHDFVFLSAEEYQKLIDRFGEQATKDKIERLNNYLGSTGKKYKSHYHTILTWAQKDEPIIAKKPFIPKVILLTHLNELRRKYQDDLLVKEHLFKEGYQEVDIVKAMEKNNG